MKMNELLTDFYIQTSNEEKFMLEKMQGVRSLAAYTEREQTVIENLIRKSLVSKTIKNGFVYVVKNDN